LIIMTACATEILGGQARRKVHVVLDAACGHEHTCEVSRDSSDVGVRPGHDLHCKPPPSALGSEHQMVAQRYKCDRHCSISIPEGIHCLPRARSGARNHRPYGLHPLPAIRGRLTLVPVPR